MTCLFPCRDGARESFTLTAGAEHERGGEEIGRIQRKAERNEEEGCMFCFFSSAL